VKVLRVDTDERKIGLSRKRVGWSEEQHQADEGNAQVDDHDALASLDHDRVLRLRRPSWFARVRPAASSSRAMK